MLCFKAKTLAASSPNSLLQSQFVVLTEAAHLVNHCQGNLTNYQATCSQQIWAFETGAVEVRSPIFRDSVCENIAEEINLLHDFAGILPDDILSLAKTVADTTPHPQQLRDDPEKRREVNIQTTALLDSINSMLED